jgi:Ca2+-binding RTX toxin-like protein
VAFDRGFNDPTTGFVSLGVFGRRFDAAGAPLGGEFRAAAPGRSTFSGEVDAAMDADGDFVIAWIGQQPDFGQTNLHTRLYAASGKALTPDREYGFDHVGPRFERVAMDDVGNYVATWQHSSEDPGDTGFGPNVFVQHFAGPDDTRPGCAAFIAGIVGTDGNDSLEGTAADDVMHARGGNDTLHAGDGADIACGGAGEDQLFGESGTDHLQGGAGDDVLDGGGDDDICNGNGQINADTAVQCERVLQVP